MAWKGSRRHKVPENQISGTTSEVVLEITRDDDNTGFFDTTKPQTITERSNRHRFFHRRHRRRRNDNDNEVTNQATVESVDLSQDYTKSDLDIAIDRHMKKYDIKTIKGRIHGTEQYVFDEPESGSDPFVDQPSNNSKSMYREIEFRNEVIPELPPLFADSDTEGNDPQQYDTLKAEETQKTFGEKLRRFFSLRHKKRDSIDENRNLNLQTFSQDQVNRNVDIPFESVQTKREKNQDHDSLITSPQNPGITSNETSGDPFSDKTKEEETSPSNYWPSSSSLSSAVMKKRHLRLGAGSESSSDATCYKRISSSSTPDNFDPFFTSKGSNVIPRANIGKDRVNETEEDDDYVVGYNLDNEENEERNTFETNTEKDKAKSIRSWFSTMFGTKRKFDKSGVNQDKLNLEDIIQNTSPETLYSSNGSIELQEPYDYEHSVSISESVVLSNATTRRTWMNEFSEMNGTIKEEQTGTEEEEEQSQQETEGETLGEEETDTDFLPNNETENASVSVQSDEHENVFSGQSKARLCHTPVETIEINKGPQHISDIEMTFTKNKSQYTDISVLKIPDETDSSLLKLPDETLILPQKWVLWKVEHRFRESKRKPGTIKEKLYYHGIGEIEDDKRFEEFIKLCQATEVPKGNEYRLYREYLVPSNIADLMRSWTKIQVKVPIRHSPRFWYFLSKIVLTRELLLEDAIQIESLFWKMNPGRSTSCSFSIYLNVDQFERELAREVVNAIISHMPTQFKLIMETSILSTAHVKSVSIYSPFTAE